MPHKIWFILKSEEDFGLHYTVLLFWDGTPKTSVPNHAYEAYKMHANHAYDAYKIHAYDAYKLHAYDAYDAYELHAYGRHAYEVAYGRCLWRLWDARLWGL